MDYAKILNSNPGNLIEVFGDFYDMAGEEASHLQEFYDAIFVGETKEAPVPITDGAKITDALKQYRIQVHSMKSSAAMIGAMGLNGMALSLEKAANLGSIAVIRDITPIFLEEWNHYKDILEEYLFAGEEANLVAEDDIVAEDDLVYEEDLIVDEDLME